MSDEPAFPVSVPMEFQYAHDGMTLRDWFAGQALSGLVVPESLQEMSPEKIASWAYAHADAMLEARQPPKDKGE